MTGSGCRDPGVVEATTARLEGRRLEKILRMCRTSLNAQTPPPQALPRRGTLPSNLCLEVGACGGLWWLKRAEASEANGGFDLCGFESYRAHRAHMVQSRRDIPDCRLALPDLCLFCLQGSGPELRLLLPTVVVIVVQRTRTTR